jgi:pimeloyl-ACP methyl ester carboxylesterase
MGEAAKLEKLNYKLYLLNSKVIPTHMQGLKNHCKNSFEVHEIEASSHYPMIENPIEFNKVLQKILNTI